MIYKDENNENADPQKRRSGGMDKEKLLCDEDSFSSDENSLGKKKLGSLKRKSTKPLEDRTKKVKKEKKKQPKPPLPKLTPIHPSDIYDKDDPLAVVEYVDDIYQNAKEREVRKSLALLFFLPVVRTN